VKIKQRNASPYEKLSASMSKTTVTSSGSEVFANTA
jgi:hypothetical protein